jgi:hypothetical protein
VSQPCGMWPLWWCDELRRLQKQVASLNIMAPFTACLNTTGHNTLGQCITSLWKSPCSHVALQGLNSMFEP